MQLRKALQGIVPEPFLSDIPQTVTLIGDIAVVTIPDHCRTYSGDIVQAVLSHNDRIKTIVNKTAKIAGEKRVAPFEIWFGTRTETIHKEAGFQYMLDIKTVFFNPRLTSEHIRIADQVRENEEVLVPFSGIGPFVLPAAARRSRVIAIDSNACACRFLRKNAWLNHLADQIETITGDCYTLDSLLRKRFDRIIVPAPYGREDILDTLLSLLKPGGTIYLYLFKKEREIAGIVASLAMKGLSIQRTAGCGNVAPEVKRWVIEMTMP
ncbi:MAG: RsmD family RNA methyltransferase [Methanospirillaceae archaeon]|nr:RsmD family RNA methyltransferase [Methanospirillaceae archaeon]